MFSQQWDGLPMFTTLNLIATKANKASKSSASTSPEKFRLRMALVRIAEAICMQNMRWENAERYQRISKRHVILGSDPLMEPIWSPTHFASRFDLHTCPAIRLYPLSAKSIESIQRLEPPARRPSRHQQEKTVWSTLITSARQVVWCRIHVAGTALEPASFIKECHGLSLHALRFCLTNLTSFQVICMASAPSVPGVGRCCWICRNQMLTLIPALSTLDGKGLATPPQRVQIFAGITHHI